MPYTPLSKVAISSRSADLYHLEISCNSRRYPATTCGLTILVVIGAQRDFFNCTIFFSKFYMEITKKKL